MVIVSGRVVERFTRKPVAGATVMIADSAVLTDVNGNFTITSPSGNYQLVITRPQYRPSSRNLALSVGDLAIGDIQIESVVRAL